LAGITVDIQRRGMSKQQVAWMENYMMPLKEQGLVEPEEERHQWVFHVAVSGRYADLHQPKEVSGDQQEVVQADQSEQSPSLLSISDRDSNFDLSPASFK
jgi:predicted ABC-type transport system involved in lysophospholipase L1 biosynthesis ATPase subunit